MNTTLFIMAALAGNIIQAGQTNIINDPNNRSNGLAYLDVSISVGDTLPVALAQARSMGFDHVRTATPQEFDDLFAAAGAESVYRGDDRPSGAFEEGNVVKLYDVPGPGPSNVLINTLGITQSARGLGKSVFLWSDPDEGNFNDPDPMTRDIINAHLWTDGRNTSVMSHSAFEPGHPYDVYVGWLLVDDPDPEDNLNASVVPEPCALWLFVLAWVLSLATKIRSME